MMFARAVNTVNGIPEPKFRAAWIALLWNVMQTTGKGYHRHSLRNLPPVGASRWRGERRADKPGTTKVSRRLAGQAAWR